MRKERDDRERGLPKAKGDARHRRHRCYIDIKASMPAAKKAIVGVPDMRLWAAEASPASTLSSLRMQFVLAVISAGQTTRLKFALCDVSLYNLCSLRIEMRACLPRVRCILEPIKAPFATGSQVLG